MTTIWKLVAALVVVASALLLLSVSIFGSLIPGVILIASAAVVARLTVNL